MWNDVLSTASDTTINRCIHCFVTAASSHSNLNNSRVREMLSRTYREPNDDSRDMYRLAAWRPAINQRIEIVVSFFKTIKRDPPNKPTSQGATPRKRHWIVTVGFDTTRDPEEIYRTVRDRCKQFYDNERPEYQGAKDWLCLYEDASGTNDGTKIQKVFDEFEKDTPQNGGKVVRRQMTNEPAYAPFTCNEFRRWEIKNILN
jgi:hypothetical protein